jgi:SAM-dependent methyltransferase
VHNSLLEKAKLQNDYYDVAVSFEVLEHIVCPLMFLNTIKGSLKKGGTLVLEVPNHNDALLSCYKEEISYKDFYYHKAHIHYFTPTSLSDLCRYCGFKGEVSSFLMYPFFNHVFWHQNLGPQPTAEIALSTPKPTNSWVVINDFYKKVEKEYEKLINVNMIGDCLIYRGKKV